MTAFPTENPEDTMDLPVVGMLWDPTSLKNWPEGEAKKKALEQLMLERGHELGRWILFSLEDGPTMAHVMHSAGLFKSVSDARRNGWDRPIEKGKWIVGKNKRIVIVN